MDCPECGAFNSMLAPSCEECGEALARPDKSAEPAPAPKKSKKRRLRERREAEEAAALEEDMEASRAQQKAGDLRAGALWLGGGLLVTLASYSAASGGGQYVVTTGAIVYGGFRLLRGFAL